MDDPRIRLTHHSLALLSAAERLQQGAGDRACAPFLPAALETMEAPASMPEFEHRRATPKAA